MRLVVCVMLWALALAPGLLVPGAQARAASPIAGAQEPGSALKIAPDAAPDAAPGAAPGAVPEVAPGVAPEGAPGVAPGAAPEVAPGAPHPRAVNPFTGVTRPGQEAGAARAFDIPGEPGPGSGLLAALARTQRELRQGLSERVRALRDGGSASGLAVFLALAFAYGALHAAGPGHGKAVAVSYVLARGEGPGRAALLGAVMGAAHAASAVALVLGLYLILERSLMARFTAQGIWLERASYALVCAIALWLLARAVRGQGAEQGARGAADRGLWATGLATGLVPCPGAAIVLLFALALGAPGIGLGAVAAMALGMGATIATAAALAALCRQRVTALAATRPRRAAILDRALSILGALAALTLGATLLAGSLG